MKSFLIERNKSEAKRSGEISWYFLPDSAISNLGKPFFKPEGRVEVALTPGFRISRLGKTISSKFWQRYIDGIAPAIHFTLKDYFNVLESNNLPTMPAIAFDKSLFIGEFRSLENNEGAGFDFFKNDDKISHIKMEDLLSDIPSILESISRLNTVKIGDLIFPSSSQSITVEAGDIITIKEGNNISLTTKIK